MHCLNLKAVKIFQATHTHGLQGRRLCIGEDRNFAVRDDQAQGMSLASGGHFGLWSAASCFQSPECSPLHRGTPTASSSFHCLLK